MTLPKWQAVACTLLAFAALSACAPERVMPDNAETVEIAVGASGGLGAKDGRARFREIYCAVNTDHGAELPDYRSCDEALMRLDPEPPPTGRPVRLNADTRPMHFFMVLGLGADCIMGLIGDKGAGAVQLEAIGHEVTWVPVEGLASSDRNARIIRDTVMDTLAGSDQEIVVLMGYSKGAPDILTAIVNYPELAERVSAVVSAAGAVGGSPLADDAEQSQANLLAKLPGSGCDTSDEGAVESLRTEVRQAWLAENELPSSIQYFSLITTPDPEHVSTMLKSGYDKLGEISYRNDSQVLFRDQIIPGSTVLAFLNADHWAFAVPIDRNHPLLGELIVNKNEFPREVLVESVLIQLQESLGL
jgi:hypothetical protein